MTEQESFVEQLIAWYRPMVTRIARQTSPRLSQDPDFLQCGLIGLWHAADGWDGAGHFPALARICITNELRSYLRRHQRELTIQATQLPLSDYQDFLPPGQEDWSGLETADLITRTWPPDSREGKILLGLLEGQSKRTLAKDLSLTTYALTRIARRAWQNTPGVTVHVP